MGLLGTGSPRSVECPAMILSDRDIRAALADGRIRLDPLDETAIQSSSLDVRLGAEFRVFANNRSPYIDVRQPSEDLTELVKASEEEPFILHPGEFVLASTLEQIGLPDDLVARLEGKSSLGRLGLLIHSSLPGDEQVLFCEVGGRPRPRPIREIVDKSLTGWVVAFDRDTLEVDYRELTGWYRGPADRIYEVVLSTGRRVRVTAGHNLFSLDHHGHVTKVRTGDLDVGRLVAVAAQAPATAGLEAEINCLDFAPESLYEHLVLQGPSVDEAFATAHDDVVAALADAGIPHHGFYRSRSRLPLSVARQVASAVGDEDRLGVRGSPATLPVRLTIDREMAWLLGLYLAEGYRRRNQVVVSNTDKVVLDRAETVLSRFDFGLYRAAGSITCCSTLLSWVLDWVGFAHSSDQARIPGVVFGWPISLQVAFVEGYTDGDGSREPTRISLWTSSPGLVDDLLWLHAMLGRRASACGRDRLDAIADGDVMWDKVVEIRDTGQTEPVYDLEVRPGGEPVENFLAGAGGVFVSNTAGFVDAGFRGHLTLELSNVMNLPITLYPGMKIGQLAFFQLSSPAEHPYGSAELGSKYQGQQGPTASRYYENFRRDDP